jgi:hypothetical protein
MKRELLRTSKLREEMFFHWSLVSDYRDLMLFWGRKRELRAGRGRLVRQDTPFSSRLLPPALKAAYSG